MTLCERCVHKNVCEIRSVQDEDDERALAECSDFFEVVRCKDCERYNKPRLKHCSLTLCYMQFDDFCSYGYKKEGAESG